MNNMFIEGTGINPHQLIILCDLYMHHVTVMRMKRNRIDLAELNHLIALGLIALLDGIWRLTKAGNSYMDWVMETSNANLSS